LAQIAGAEPKNLDLGVGTGNALATHPSVAVPNPETSPVGAARLA
jgi:hypothetical protein